MEFPMSQAAIESIPTHTIVTLTAEEVRNLADRLFSRGISTISKYSRREQEDLVLPSRALRELVRLYARGTRRELHALMLDGGC
jgi:hypothetical protein